MRGRAARSGPAGTSARRPCSVTRSAAISASAGAGSQRSISTALVPSRAGARMAWITPEMWVSGDGMSVRSRGVSACMRARLRTSAVRVLCVCRTPLGSAVVPEVYISISNASASTASTTRSAVCGARSHGVSRNAAKARIGGGASPRATSTSRRAGSCGAQRGDQRGVVAAAEAAGNDQHRRARLAQDEAQLALAEHRQHRVDDGADARRGEEDDRRLPPIGQLVGDDVARADAERKQPERGALRQALPLGEAQSSIAVDQRDRHSGARRRSPRNASAERLAPASARRGGSAPRRAG